MKSKEVIHRDLAARWEIWWNFGEISRNILLKKDGVAAVSDFGLAKIKESNEDSSKTKNNIGSLKWWWIYLFNPYHPLGLHLKVQKRKSTVRNRMCLHMELFCMRFVLNQNLGMDSVEVFIEFSSNFLNIISSSRYKRHWREKNGHSWSCSKRFGKCNENVSNGLTYLTWEGVGNKIRMKDQTFPRFLIF